VNRQQIDALAEKGYAALQAGHLEAARADLETALDGYRSRGITDNWTSAALGNLGRAYTLLGRHHDGVEAIRRALALKRRNREDAASLHTALSNLALALQAAGDQDGAAAALAEAAALPGLSADRRRRIAQEQAFHRMDRGDFPAPWWPWTACSRRSSPRSAPGRSRRRRASAVTS
jgi:tetratricopeptide (TPR) repeat protein